MKCQPISLAVSRLSVDGRTTHERHTIESLEMSSSVPIPKFTSFRPKAVDGDVAKAEKPVKRSDHGGTEGRERKHHHRRHRSRSRERPPKQVVEERLLVQVAAKDSGELFIEDRRGDVQNLVYGSIHRYSIPAFHRIGAGSVIGAKPSLKIERDSAEDKGIILNDRRDERRGEREKYAFARNEKKTPRLLRIRPDVAEDVAVADNPDFIAFRNSRPRKRQRLGSESEYSSDEDKNHYRSIEGKAKVVIESLEEGLEWASDSGSSDLEAGRTIKFDEALRKENVRLSQRVNEHPGDVEAWVALIDHQDSLLGWADEGHQKITTAERRSTADIKLHMYEKALTKAGSTLANRERLLLGLMAEGAKIWDFKTQSERWEQVSQNNLDSILLWKQYLDFRQCTFAAFRYEEVRGIFLKRIKLLKQAIEKGEQAGTDTSVLFEHLIYTILRVTLYMREAGFSELAIAIWQALLEFNFLGPTPPISSSSRLDSFREFWDSEVLRIGEDGAKGWKSFTEDIEAPDPKFDQEIPQKYLMTENIFDGWVAAEKLRATASKMPARTLDETVEDDPYRVILWSDIEDFLIDLSSSSWGIDTGHLLLDAFLIFCRLPPVPCTDKHTSRQWWIDSFSRGEMLDCNPNWIRNHVMEERTVEALITDGSPIVKMTGEPRRFEGSGPFEWPFQYFAGSPDTLFGPDYWGKYLMSWRTPYADQGSEKGQGNEQHSDSDPIPNPDRLDSPVPYSWLQNTLKSLVDAVRNEQFAEYYLAFEFFNEPQDIKKLAKSLLKNNPQSLRLYNAYAMIERLRGNTDVSTNVITAALGMHASLPQNEQQGSIILWKTWTWAFLDEGDNIGALRCLCSIADKSPSNMNTVDVPSPAALLKAKQHLSSFRDFSISSRDNYRATVYTECLALLEYLSSGSGTEASSMRQGDIVFALAVFETFSNALAAQHDSPNIPLELMLQSAARLLYHHARSGPFRPALLRDHLTQSLALFPRNTIFLSLYSWNESRLRIDDRIRAMLRSMVLTEANDNIISRLFAIRHEMHAGNVHSTLAAFENAVSNSSCRSNPSLWRFYVLFCANSREIRHKAKDIFLRGMRACPWAKDLIMMAFTELEGLGTRDKIAIYKVLVEKELRIHVDVEQRIEEWQYREHRRAQDL